MKWFLRGISLFIVGLSFYPMDFPGRLITVGVGLLMLLMSFCFATLAVVDEGTGLRMAFGPIPLFQQRVEYIQMEDARIGRTLVIDGWGIHYSIRGGQVWNLWGRDCVEIRLVKGGKLWIGTDDATGLAAFLATRIPIDRKAGR